MRSAGTLGDTSTGLNPFPFLTQRDIPSCYADDNERWVLEASGWTSYGWDVPNDGESALDCGKLPSTTEPAQEAQGRNRATDAANIPFSGSMDGSRLISEDLDCGLASVTQVRGFDSSASTQEPQTNLSFPLPAHSIVDAQANLALFNSTSDASNLLQVFTSSQMPYLTFPKMPKNTLAASSPNTPAPSSTSSTPALSPSSSSTCSLDLEDSEGEAELPAPTVMKFNGESNSAAKSTLAKEMLGLELDANFFSQPVPAGHPQPMLSFHPATAYEPSPFSAPQTHIPQATIAPTLLELCRTESMTPQPTCGPIRTAASSSQRAARPYERAFDTRKERKTESDEIVKYNIKMRCSECGYQQIPGPGDQRSFKRHLETHVRYRKAVWRCKGCRKVYSRRDALLRHLRTTDTGCDLDCISCEPPYGSDTLEA